MYKISTQIFLICIVCFCYDFSCAAIGIYCQGRRVVKDRCIITISVMKPYCSCFYSCSIKNIISVSKVEIYSVTIDHVE